MENAVRVRFTEQFDFAPPETGGRVVIRYKAGKTYRGVRRIAAERAEALGKGVIVQDEAAIATAPARTMRPLDDDPTTPAADVDDPTDAAAGA